jgi:hypothetical protein
MKKAITAAKKESRRTLPTGILDTAIFIATPTFPFLILKLPSSGPRNLVRVSARGGQGNFIWACGAIMFIFTAFADTKTAGQKG